MVLEPVAQHGYIFRGRKVLIRQRTRLIYAFRGQLTEFGQVVPQRPANVPKLIMIVEDPTCGLPSEALATLQVLILSLRHLEAEIIRLDAEIARRAKEDNLAQAADDDPGYRPADRHSLCDAGPRGRDLPQTPGFCSLLAPMIAV